MTMKLSTRIILAAITLAAAAEVSIEKLHAAPRPNVLLVLLDDLGFSDLGCYGGEIPTPNVDRLGAGGLRYTGMTNSARCCPSRASLLTGLHPAQAGIPNFGGDLNARCATLAEVLKEAGYGTYAVGKWHVGASKAASPTARGFDEFYGFTAGHSQDQWEPSRYRRLPEGRTPEVVASEGGFYATDVFTDYALEFLRQAQTKRRPWFLYLAHSAPHFPIQAPAASAQQLVPVYKRGWDVLREERFERMRRLGVIDHDGWKLTGRSLVPVEENDAIANGFSGKENPAWASLPEDRRDDLARRMALYAAMVVHVDRGLGRIVERLAADGALENTLILLLSDNGACYEWGPFGFDGVSRAAKNVLHAGKSLETMGGPGQGEMSYGSAWANLCNTPFKLYKHFTHRGGIATPFIVHWPAGVTSPGRWVRDAAHVMDIMPTLADACRASYPKTRDGKDILPMEGVSLVPTFAPNGHLAGRSLCYQHQGARAIHKGNWKLVYGKRYPTPVSWELYDLDADPCETRDLAAQHPELVKQLAAEWEAWAARTGSLGNPGKGGKAKRK